MQRDFTTPVIFTFIRKCLSDVPKLILHHVLSGKVFNCHVLSENESLNPVYIENSCPILMPTTHSGGVYINVTVSKRLISELWHCQTCGLLTVISGRLMGDGVRVKYSSANYRLWNLGEIAHISKGPFSENNTYPTRLQWGLNDMWNI